MTRISKYNIDTTTTLKICTCPANDTDTHKLHLNFLFASKLFKYKTIDTTTSIVISNGIIKWKEKNLKKT